jgi:hypothetical protein
MGGPKNTAQTVQGQKGLRGSGYRGESLSSFGSRVIRQTKLAHGHALGKLRPGHIDA